MLADFESLRHLPIADKLRVVEALWDDILQSNEAFPLQEWHRLEVERRLAEIEKDPSAVITREELWRRVDGARG
jgi:putative addiction module component (TIGR02574 family)